MHVTRQKPPKFFVQKISLALEIFLNHNCYEVNVMMIKYLGDEPQKC